MAQVTKAKTKTKPARQLDLDKFLPWLLLVGGLIVMVASLLLTIEVFNRLKNPQFIPICDLNPIFSCSSVADSSQSHAFGFPNYFIGIAAYASVATVGAAMLAGATYKRWFWRLFQLGVTFAIVFTTWLQFQALYRIGALCLFCMILWLFTIPIFWYTTLYNLRRGHLSTPTRLRAVLSFAQRHHADVLISWYLIIILLILKRFWYYWSSLV